MNKDKKLAIVLVVFTILLVVSSALEKRIERKELHIGRGYL